MDVNVLAKTKASEIMGDLPRKHSINPVKNQKGPKKKKDLYYGSYDKRKIDFLQVASINKDVLNDSSEVGKVNNEEIMIPMQRETITIPSMTIFKLSKEGSKRSSKRSRKSKDRMNLRLRNNLSRRI